jgi:chloramphenicol-sensitive protein RarD
VPAPGGWDRNLEGARQTLGNQQLACRTGAREPGVREAPSLGKRMDKHTPCLENDAGKPPVPGLEEGPALYALPVMRAGDSEPVPTPLIAPAPVPECNDIPAVVPVHPSPSETRIGVLYALAAFLFWGLSVLYFKAVAHVPPFEILAHRILWAVPLLLGWLAARGRLGELWAALRERRNVGILLITTLLIGSNWLLFIIAVASGRVTQTSLGYYINPLLNVLLGVAFLGERLRRLQVAGVLRAAAGVIYMALSLGFFPWISLVLAGTFGLYGLLRKTVPVDGPVGLTVETSLLLPVVIVYLIVQTGSGQGTFLHGSRTTDVLLVLAGLVTTLPLLWFTNGVRRLRLATMGFLQYLSPTLQLLIAVLVFGEPFTRTHLVTFACIWGALALYSADALRHR